MLLSRRWLFALFCLTLLLPVAGWGQAQQGLPVSPLTIVTAKGERHAFTVEIANTEASRERGLMFRRTMAPDAGMLFDFFTEAPQAFWMKNTYIPLDMLFVRANGEILNIRQRAIPQDESSIASDGPVRAVLELNGGTVARLGIRPGDHVQHAIFSGK